MVQTEVEMRAVYGALRPGDLVEVEHEVKVGMKVWQTTAAGQVVRTDRQRHSLHHDRSADDKVWSDVLVLLRPDGELTTLTIDEFTRIRRTEAAETGNTGEAQ